jgi:hypothetical protein
MPTDNLPVPGVSRRTLVFRSKKVIDLFILEKVSQATNSTKNPLNGDFLLSVHYYG